MRECSGTFMESLHSFFTIKEVAIMTFRFSKVSPSQATIALCAAISFAVPAGTQAQTAPVASDNAAHNPATKSPDKMTGVPLAKGATSFTKEQAKKRLEEAGFSHVTGLVKDSDGLWQARAMHGGQWVKAAVDYKGNVAAR
jgi:hypothetical protein